MAEERIRLSDRARKKVKALAEQADTDLNFFLEYLINRYGSSAVAEMCNFSPSPRNYKPEQEASSDTKPDHNASTNETKSLSAADRLRSLRSK